MHESFLNDTTFWYAVSAVLCVAFIFHVARKAVAGWLDGEIAKVVSELHEAKRLREEASETLEDYKLRQAVALQEAEDIVAKAKADAARLREETKAELQATLDRHEKLAMERIELVQEEAANEVRAFVIDEAMRELRGKMANHAKTAESAKILDDIIAELPKLSLAK